LELKSNTLFRAAWKKIDDSIPFPVVEVGDYHESFTATQRIETQRRHARENNERALKHVQRMERVVGVVVRWSADGREYAEAAELVRLRDYHKALDTLAGDVAAHSLELPGSGIQGLGTS
jgi:hypothetical protein